MNAAQWLFQPTIDGQASWAELFQSIEAFAPLIEAIYSANRLEMGEIRNLTPGTNAVFRIHDTVVKIFAPTESGFNTYDDYFTELSALNHANGAGVTAPRLLCSGGVEDRYLFRYIVMGFIDGEEAEHCLPCYPTERKREFAYKLKTITAGLNVEIHDRNIPVLQLSNIIDNQRWNEFPARFCEDRKAFLREIRFPEPVYTHGDLTGENIIVDKNGDMFVIDYADSRIAPYYYEWPPIVFGLFGCDPIMMEAYYGDFHNDDFFELLTRSVLIHDFGAVILRQICDIADISKNTIGDVSGLKRLLRASVDRGWMKVR